MICEVERFVQVGASLFSIWLSGSSVRAQSWIIALGLRQNGLAKKIPGP